MRIERGGSGLGVVPRLKRDKLKLKHPPRSKPQPHAASCLLSHAVASNQNWCRNSVCGGPQPSTSYVSLDW